MTASGPARKPGGFMAGLQRVMAPVIPEDDGGPIVRPRTVTIASVLAMVAGVLFLLIGAISVSTVPQQTNTVVQSYADAVNECNTYVGGIGSAVPTTVKTPTSVSGPIAATALPSACAQATETSISESSLSSIKTQIVVTSVILILVGLATALSGWFLRQGQKWPRRVLIGMVVVQLALAFLFQVSNVVTLLCTLLIVVSLSMTFLGRAGAYFISVSLRKKLH